MTQISIILPIYNVEKYLKRCVDSILSQTLKDIEIILATDGPESCDKICEEYALKDNRVKVVMHPGSYGKAFNKSLKIASGDYIGIVETDDWCDLTMFEKLYNRAKQTNADVVKCGWWFAYDDKNKNFSKNYYAYPNQLDLKETPDFFSSQPAVWSCIYKKEFLVKNQILMVEERMPYIDVPFHCETICKAQNYQLLKEPLYYYYQDNPNQTVQNIPTLAGVKSEKITYEKLKDTKCLTEYKEGFLHSTICRFLWNYNNMSKTNLPIFWKAAQEFLNTVNLEKVAFKYFSNYELAFFKALLNESYYSYKRKEKFLNFFLIMNIRIIKNIKLFPF